MDAPEFSMQEYIEELRSDRQHLLVSTQCTPDDFHRVLEALLDLPEKALPKLSSRASRYPYGWVLSIDPAQIPADRTVYVARILSGTPDPIVYETIATLLETDFLGDRRRCNLGFARSFSFEPNPEGAKRIADRLLALTEDRRLKTEVLLILARWQNLGVVTDRQAASIVDAVLDSADPHSSGIMTLLPEDVAVPWLLETSRSPEPEVAARAIGGLHGLGRDIPTEVLQPLRDSMIGLGALMQNARVQELMEPSLPAATMARAGMAWHFMLQSGEYGRWKLGDPDLEIEQVGLVDGESVSTTGVIFVFRYRLPALDAHEWMVGVSGPYSVDEEPARHLGGLDFTNGQIIPSEGLLEDQVEDLFGISLTFSSLATKREDTQ